ncbi:hypothetical protein BGZ54_000857, partial [Gamsiella multidivaricata]
KTAVQVHLKKNYVPAGLVCGVLLDEDEILPDALGELDDEAKPWKSVKKKKKKKKEKRCLGVKAQENTGAIGNSIDEAVLSFLCEYAAIK